MDKMYEYEPIGDSSIKKFQFILVAFESPVFDKNGGLKVGDAREENENAD